MPLSYNNFLKSSGLDFLSALTVPALFLLLFNLMTKSCFNFFSQKLAFQWLVQFSHFLDSQQQEQPRLKLWSYYVTHQP